MLDHKDHNWQAAWLAKILRFLGAIYVRKVTVKQVKKALEFHILKNS